MYHIITWAEGRVYLEFGVVLQLEVIMIYTDQSRWAKLPRGQYLGVSENNGTPKSSHFNRIFHYKPSILGYPYFWKHPFRETIGCNPSQIKGTYGLHLQGAYLEIPSQLERSWPVTPIFKPFGRGQPYLGNLLTMVINHLLNSCFWFPS